MVSGFEGYPVNELMSLGTEYRMQQLVELRVRLWVKGGLLRPFERVASCCVLYQIPKPPRRTSLFWKSCPSSEPGLQLKPTCGPKFLLEVAVRSPPFLMVHPVR